jgi:hypothetical protein
MLSLVFYFCYAECHYAECHSDKCRGAQLTVKLGQCYKTFYTGNYHRRDGNCPTLLIFVGVA